MIDAVSDFTNLAASFGNMTNSLIRLHEVNVQVESEWAGAQLDKINADFYTDINRPIGDPLRVSIEDDGTGVYWRKRMEDRDAQVNSIMGQIKSDRVRGSVESRLKEQTTGFMTRVSSDMAQAEVNRIAFRASDTLNTMASDTSDGAEAAFERADSYYREKVATGVFNPEQASELNAKIILPLKGKAIADAYLMKGNRDIDAESQRIMSEAQASGDQATYDAALKKVEALEAAKSISPDKAKAEIMASAIPGNEKQFAIQAIDARTAAIDEQAKGEWKSNFEKHTKTRTVNEADAQNMIRKYSKAGASEDAIDSMKSDLEEYQFNGVTSKYYELYKKMYEWSEDYKDDKSVQAKAKDMASTFFADNKAWSDVNGEKANEMYKFIESWDTKDGSLKDKRTEVILMNGLDDIWNKIKRRVLKADDPEVIRTLGAATYMSGVLGSKALADKAQSMRMDIQDLGNNITDERVRKLVDESDTLRNFIISSGNVGFETEYQKILSKPKNKWTASEMSKIKEYDKYVMFNRERILNFLQSSPRATELEVSKEIARINLETASNKKWLSSNNEKLFAYSVTDSNAREKESRMVELYKNAVETGAFATRSGTTNLVTYNPYLIDEYSKIKEYAVEKVKRVTGISDLAPISNDSFNVRGVNEGDITLVSVGNPKIAYQIDTESTNMGDRFTFKKYEFNGKSWIPYVEKKESSKERGNVK